MNFEVFIILIPKDTLNKEINKWGNIPGYNIEQVESFLDY